MTRESASSMPDETIKPSALITVKQIFPDTRDMPPLIPPTSTHPIATLSPTGGSACLPMGRAVTATAGHEKKGTPVLSWCGSQIHNNGTAPDRPLPSPLRKSPPGSRPSRIFRQSQCLCIEATLSPGTFSPSLATGSQTCGGYICTYLGGVSSPSSSEGGGGGFPHESHDIKNVHAK
jgi:hypothetical protein